VDKTRVEDIVWQWEADFLSAELDPSVARVMKLMTPGGNLAAWAASYKTTSDLHDDPSDIKNWDWDKFKKELLLSHLHVPVDKKKILNVFNEIVCALPGTEEQTTAYTSAFAMGLQTLRKYHLYSRYTPETIAQQFYDSCLTSLVHYHMALWNDI
jgi:hypothetical protein